MDRDALRNTFPRLDSPPPPNPTQPSAVAIAPRTRLILIYFAARTFRTRIICETNLLLLLLLLYLPLPAVKNKTSLMLITRRHNGRRPTYGKRHSPATAFLFYRARVTPPSPLVADRRSQYRRPNTTRHYYVLRADHDVAAFVWCTLGKRSFSDVRFAKYGRRRRCVRTAILYKLLLY